jgi:large subunit ribosomal protein L21
MTLGQVFDLTRDFRYYSGLGLHVFSAGRLNIQNAMESTMYAVIKTGGKQYRVAPGEKIKIEQIPADVGAQIVLDQVLMVSDGDALKVGNPLVSGAKVSATVIAHGRGTKIKIFKLRRRKHYQKTQGHRQNYTEIRVDAIA